MDTSNKQQQLRSSSSNKIRQIVRLQQLLKKWKKIAAASPSSTHLQLNTTTTTTTISTSSSINKFLKKTLSFSEKDKDSINAADHVPKGCLAVCVGKEEKRFVIPMDYLTHQSFQVLLREAEEEFGFQQQGVLKFPCEVSLFDNILKMIMTHDHPTPTLTTTSTPPPAPTPTLIPTPSNKKQQPDTLHNVGCCSPDNHQHIMPPQLCS